MDCARESVLGPYIIMRYAHEKIPRKQMANTHKDNNTIRSEQAKFFWETRRTLMIIQLIVRNSELSASACAAATGLGMAAAG